MFSGYPGKDISFFFFFNCRFRIFFPSPDLKYVGLKNYILRIKGMLLWLKDIIHYHTQLFILVSFGKFLDEDQLTVLNNLHSSLLQHWCVGSFLSLHSECSYCCHETLRICGFSRIPSESLLSSCNICSIFL